MPSAFKLSLLVLAVVAVVTFRNVASEPADMPPEPQAQIGVRCLLANGNADYCRCLARLELARETAALPAPPLPAMDHPAVRYARSHPRLYPIINGDTVRCVPHGA